MDCTVHGVAKSWTPLSDFRFHFPGANCDKKLQIAGTVSGPSRLSGSL